MSWLDAGVSTHNNVLIYSKRNALRWTGRLTTEHIQQNSANELALSPPLNATNVGRTFTSYFSINSCIKHYTVNWSYFGHQGNFGHRLLLITME